MGGSLQHNTTTTTQQHKYGMMKESDYFDDYLDAYNFYRKFGENFRLKITPVEFIEQVEILNTYINEIRSCGHYTEYDLQLIKKRFIETLLETVVTPEELLAKINSLEESDQHLF